MELLNISPAPVLPSTMWLVYRALTDTGGLTRDELMDAACPPTMRSETPGNGAHVKRAVDALTSFGPVEASDDAVLHAVDRLDLDAFRRALRHNLLQPIPDSESPAEDLVRGLRWLVVQPPSETYEFPASDVFVNDTRYNTFNYWAPFLGFAREWPMSEGERSVDPTVAVEDAIFHPFGAELPNGTMEIGVLLRHIESEIPLLRTSEVDGVPTVLASTALALRSLIARGRLRLERAADAKSVVRLPAGAGAAEEDYYSHATVLGATT